MLKPRDTDRGAALFDSYLRRPSRRRLERVARVFSDHVWRTALRLTGNEDDAADITQDVFLSLLLDPPRSGSVRSPEGYLAFRVITLARRRERAGQRRRRRENRAARRVLESSGTDSDDVDALREAVRELPDKLRTAIELRYLGGFRNREIAELLGVSTRSVEEYLHQGRDKLRASLRGTALGAGLLAITPSREATAAPASALDRALRVVRSGHALRPLSATALAGGVVMKKLAVVAAVLLLISGLVTWRILRDESSPVAVVPLAPDTRTASGVAGRAQPEPSPDAEIVVKEVEPGFETSPPQKVEYRARVSGRVIDEGGRPVSDARVSALLTPLTARGRKPKLVGEATSARPARGERDPGGRRLRSPGESTRRSSSAIRVQRRLRHSG